MAKNQKLSDLNPEFVGSGGTGVFNAKTGEPVPRREGIGITCDCPCDDPDCDSPLFVHFENPLDGKPATTQSPKWKRTGETFDNMTLRPSLKRMDGCKWHGYLTNGVFDGKCEK